MYFICADTYTRAHIHTYIRMGVLSPCRVLPQLVGSCSTVSGVDKAGQSSSILIKDRLSTGRSKLPAWMIILRKGRDRARKNEKTKEKRIDRVGAFSFSVHFLCCRAFPILIAPQFSIALIGASEKLYTYVYIYIYIYTAMHSQIRRSFDRSFPRVVGI